jgi:Uma2 family endonuclease
MERALTIAGSARLRRVLTKPRTKSCIWHWHAFRDETIKRRLYERSGVTEYWIVDPKLDVIRIYRRGSTGFEQPVELSAAAHDVLTTPLLPEAELPLAKIFTG